jgi:hypothetical protein
MSRSDSGRDAVVEMLQSTDDGSLVDPRVTLPADVKAAIARGEAAFERQRKSVGVGRSIEQAKPRIITSVVDQQVQDRRDIILDTKELQSRGARQQPPMIARLRAVMILVDRLVADGVPFGVGPNSKLNKAVHSWLETKAEQSADIRKSRQKAITPSAVRALLKQVRALRS